MGLQYEAAVTEGRKFAENFCHLLRSGETDDQFRDRFRHYFWLTFTAAKYKKKMYAETHAIVDLNLAALRNITDSMRGATIATGVNQRRNIPKNAPI